VGKEEQIQRQSRATFQLPPCLTPRDDGVDAVLGEQVGADVHKPGQRRVQQLVVVHGGLQDGDGHDGLQRLQQRVRL